MALDAAGIEALLTGVLNARDEQERNRTDKVKVPNLSSASADDWRIWRANFETAAELNRWTNRTARLHLACSMTGDAKNQVTGIPHGCPAGVAPAGGGAVVYAAAPPFVALLDEYEARFMPPAEGELALINYETAEQLEGEIVSQWHNRLRTLCQRAHPNLANIENDLTIRRRFINGLQNQDVRMGVTNANPATYAAARDEASRQSASYMIRQLAMQGQKPRGRNLEGNIASIDGAGPAVAAASNRRSEGCWQCGQDGHIRRDCPNARSGQRPGRGRRPGRGGRGSSRGQGKPKPGQKGGWNRNPKKVAAMSANIDDFLKQERTGAEEAESGNF